METSQSIKEIAAALANAQSTIQAAAKDSVNPHFRSTYADLKSVWDVCRPVLGANGLSVVQMPIESEPGRAALETLLMHTSGEFIRAKYSTKIVPDNAQGVGSAITYLRRYALSATLGIVTEEDDDGNGASQRQPPQQQRPSTNAPASAPKSTPYSETFVERLGAAIDARNLGEHSGAILKKIMADLKKKYAMDETTITPEVGGKLIKAVIDGKFDPKPLKEKAAA